MFKTIKLKTCILSSRKCYNYFSLLYDEKGECFKIIRLKQGKYSLTLEINSEFQQPQKYLLEILILR